MKQQLVDHKWFTSSTQYVAGKYKRAKVFIANYIIT